MDQRVIWRAFEYAAYVIFTFGTRAHDRHLANEHVPELRQFVKPVFAQYVANARDAFVVGRRECRAVFLGIDAHGAEFQYVERFLVIAYALLAVQLLLSVALGGSSLQAMGAWRLLGYADLRAYP